MYIYIYVYILCLHIFLHICISYLYIQLYNNSNIFSSKTSETSHHQVTCKAWQETLGARYLMQNCPVVVPTYLRGSRFDTFKETISWCFKQTIVILLKFPRARIRQPEINLVCGGCWCFPHHHTVWMFLNLIKLELDLDELAEPAGNQPSCQQRLLMEDIPHQLRLVVYPRIYRVLYIPAGMQDFFHQ